MVLCGFVLRVDTLLLTRMRASQNRTSSSELLSRLGSSKRSWILCSRQSHPPIPPPPPPPRRFIARYYIVVK